MRLLCIQTYNGFLSIYLFLLINLKLIFREEAEIGMDSFEMEHGTFEMDIWNLNMTVSPLWSVTTVVTQSYSDFKCLLGKCITGTMSHYCLWDFLETWEHKICLLWYWNIFPYTLKSTPISGEGRVFNLQFSSNAWFFVSSEWCLTWEEVVDIHPEIVKFYYCKTVKFRIHIIFVGIGEGEWGSASLSLKGHSLLNNRLIKSG